MGVPIALPTCGDGCLRPRRARRGGIGCGRSGPAQKRRPARRPVGGSGTQERAAAVPGGGGGEMPRVARPLDPPRLAAMRTDLCTEQSCSSDDLL